MAIPRRGEMTQIQRRAFLKSQYFRMKRADELDTCLQALVEDFDAGNLSGARFEAGGLMVIGESGTGKSKEIEQALVRLQQKSERLECGIEVNFISHMLTGESKWKSVGLALLHELKYELSAKRTEHEIWDRVRAQLKGQGIWLVHMDECQHMFQTTGESETRRILNAFKTLMKYQDWPVIVILSGVPELRDKINLDPQLRELLLPYYMSALDPRSKDLDEIDTAFYGLAESVGIDITEIRSEDAYSRLSYGHEDLYGRIFRFIVFALGEMPDGVKKLTLEHLAECYARKTGCQPGQNVFLREDYQACCVSVLMPD